MKVALVHNCYGKHSGEESVVRDNEKLLVSAGVEVVSYCRSSADLIGFRGNVRGFFSGIWNPFSNRDFRKFLERENPDVVHVHNLYPLIGHGILRICHESHVPVVMTVHNYRMICPDAQCFREGGVCHLCATSRFREFQCVLHNCENGFFKSLGYCLRSLVARWRHVYDFVDRFVVLTEFQRNLLAQNGFPAEKMCVLGNCLPSSVPAFQADGAKNGYVLYMGRIGMGKGVETFVEAARLLPQYRFVIAGTGDLGMLDGAPKNVLNIGFVDGETKACVERDAAIVVVPSQWYEGCPMVILEAMRNGKALVVSDFKSLLEISHGSAIGFKRNDAADLAATIDWLMHNPEEMAGMGRRGRKMFLKHYCSDVYVDKLLDVYRLLTGSFDC
ncbi:MAG: glycosyltransferase family 4 protein [Victivallaceae bacterium]|nr:glycosyltransferase family 4 protein [Victivallaceae bacterium]